jgi:hypothetical protein
LSENLERALGVVRGLTGLPALVLACALTVVCIGLAPLVWYLDLDSTLQWTDTIITIVVPTIPAEFAAWVSVISLALTLLPSAIELFTARFAVRIPAAASLVYTFSLIDMVTDYPRVRTLLAGYQPAFESLGLLATPAYWLAHPLLLFLASFGFELLLIVFSVTALVLFINAGQHRTYRQSGHATIDM